jgi:hypothetical protein
MDEDPKEIARLFASKFIARSDVKAIQRPAGEYNPTVERDAQGHITKMHPFAMKDLLDHISGTLTYGHYLLNPDNQCKLFAFDIDLDEPKEGKPDLFYLPTECDSDGVWTNFMPDNPREAWLDRTKVLQRNYLKYQFRMLYNAIARTIFMELGLVPAMTYTGAKGVHVYAFTGLLPAKDVRDGAEIILEKMDRFQPHFGNNFYKHKPIPGIDGQRDFYSDFHQFTIEVFPKQVTVSPGGFGNLMRLPLGRNLKNPKDPTFFLDPRGNFGEQSFMRRDAVDALTTTDPWK